MNDKPKRTIPLSEIQIDTYSALSIHVPAEIHKKLKTIMQDTGIRQQDLLARLLTWAVVNYDNPEPETPRALFPKQNIEATSADEMNDLARHIMASQFKAMERGDKLETGSHRARFIAIVFIINMVVKSGQHATTEKISAMLDSSVTVVAKLVQVLEQRGVIVRTRVRSKSGNGRTYWLQITPNAVAALNKAHRAETGKPIFPALSAQRE